MWHIAGVAERPSGNRFQRTPIPEQMDQRRHSAPECGDSIVNTAETGTASTMTSQDIAHDGGLASGSATWQVSGVMARVLDTGRIDN
jgi:hypothetical protein